MDPSTVYTYALHSFQDKSRFIAPEVVRSLLFQLTLAKEKAASLIPGEIRPIFNDGDDVIIVNSESGSHCCIFCDTLLCATY